MKLCVSIAPHSMQEAFTLIREARKYSDLIEVRVDNIRDLNLQRLLKKPRPAFIITNRHCEEGGSFEGSDREFFSVMKEAINCGAEYVDAELRWGKSMIDRLQSTNKSTRMIISYHNTAKTPSLNILQSLYRRMTSFKPDVIKIVTTANNIADTNTMFKILQLAQHEKPNMIGLCMGEHGQVSRILSGTFNSWLTFGSLGTDRNTAPGQYEAHVLKETFHVDTINAKTNIFGLIGNPVAFSPGIYFHNAIFLKKAVNAVYVNFLVSNLSTFTQSLMPLGKGYSVTMPYKQQIVSYLDKVEGSALELGIVNTVINRKGKFIGLNTDLPAIVSLLRKRSTIRNKYALVLGTGATASTMAYAVLQNGGNVTIAGRSIAKAKILAKQFGCSWIPLHEAGSLSPDILLNGTSVGMTSNESLVPSRLFRNDMIVFDAVRSSALTPMLRDAKAAGSKIISGNDFFEKQAKLQSTIFLECLQ